MDDYITFWSVPDSALVKVHKSVCRRETIVTSKGVKHRLLATVILPDGKVRKFSKFVSADFVL